MQRTGFQMLSKRLFHVLWRRGFGLGVFLSSALFTATVIALSGVNTMDVAFSMMATNARGANFVFHTILQNRVAQLSTEARRFLFRSIFLQITAHSDIGQPR
ncbi:MAG: hypothetical protein Q7R65_03785 [bacterium]|nr:hypothetical protein [bacterium]